MLTFFATPRGAGLLGINSAWIVSTDFESTSIVCNKSHKLPYHFNFDAKHYLTYMYQIYELKYKLSILIKTHFKHTYFRSTCTYNLAPNALALLFCSMQPFIKGYILVDKISMWSYSGLLMHVLWILLNFIHANLFHLQKFLLESKL